MHLLFVIQSHEDASARVRALQYAPALEKAGISCSVVAAHRGDPERATLLEQARQADVVFLQRRLLNGWDFRALRRASRRLVFDFDDAISIKDDLAGARRSATRAARFRRSVLHADRVIAGNAHLAAQVPSRARRKVTVIPSVTDTARWRPEPRGPSSGPPTIGWLGSASTLPYFEALGAPLARVQHATGCRVVVVADRAPATPGVDVDFHPWQMNHEVAELNAMDVGLMPLPDSPWTRGKCGYKLILYLACGVPAVASPVGVNPDIVRHGETGLLADDPDDWVATLEQLLADRALRQRLGQSGREHVEQHYSLQAWQDAFVRVVSDWET